MRRPSSTEAQDPCGILEERSIGKPTVFTTQLPLDVPKRHLYKNDANGSARRMISELSAETHFRLSRAGE